MKRLILILLILFLPFWVSIKRVESTGFSMPKYSKITIDLDGCEKMKLKGFRLLKNGKEVFLTMKDLEEIFNERIKK